jgi:hypothetical protein
MIFSDDQKAEKQSLIELLATTTEEKKFAEIQKKIFELNKLEKQAFEGRNSELQSIFKSVHDHKVTFKELLDATYNGEPLFSKAEITKAVSKAKTVRKKASGLVIFQLKKEEKSRGIAPVIRLDSSLPPTAGIGFVKLFQQQGDLTKNLMSCKVQSAEVDAFLSTAQGKEFVQKWVNWIKEMGPKALAKTSEANIDQK